MSFPLPSHDAIVTFVGWSLIHSLWIGMAIVIGVEVLMSSMRHATPRGRHVTLACALVLIPIAAIVVTLHEEDESDRPRSAVVASSDPIVSQVAPEERTNHRNQADSPASVQGDGGLLDAEASAGGSPDSPPADRAIGADRAAPEGQPAVGSVARPQAAGSAPVGASAPWITWIVWAWLTGVAVLTMRLLFGSVSLFRLARCGTSPVPDEVVRSVKRISRQIGLSRIVRTVLSPLAAAPATIGFFRPLILLPPSVLTSLTPKELEAILAHELAHVARGDFLFNVLQTIVEVLLFYHPAVWHISRQIRSEREHACDDLAIQVTGDRLGYARALLRVAERTTHERLAMAANGGHFSGRILRILGRDQQRPSGTLRILSAGVLATFVVGSTLALFYPAESVAIASAADPSATDARLGLIAGTVADTQRRPLADVTVYLRRRPFSHHQGPVELAHVTTGEDGRFEFRDVRVPADFVQEPERLFPLDVIAVQAGCAIRWQRLSSAQTGIAFRLKRETPFSGVLTDEAGAPVPRAKIRVRNLMSLNTLSKIDVGAGHTPSANGDSFLDISEFVAAISASTDQDGRFVLRGLPNRVGMLLDVDDRRLVAEEWYAATTSEPLPAIPAGKVIYPPRGETVDQIMQRRVRAELVPVHADPAVLQATRGVRLNVHVVSEQGDQPVTGASVTFNQGAESATVTVTGADGGCEHHRLAPGSTVRLKVVPPDNADLLGWEGTIPLSSDHQANHEVRLIRGVPVSGRVVDQASGDGVEDARVSFIREDATVRSGRAAQVATDAEGSFRLVTPVARGRIVLVSAPAGYRLPAVDSAQAPNARAETPVLEPIPGTPVTGLTLQIQRQPAMPLAFTTESGQPLAITGDARIYYRSNTYSTRKVETDATGQLDVSRLVRGSQLPKAFQILARSMDGRRAGFFRTKDLAALQNGSPHAIVLRPTASVGGRITDKSSGGPIPNARVSLSVSYTETGGQGVAAFTCDTNGSYSFDRLVPGMQYAIGVAADGYLSVNSIRHRFPAKPAERHELNVALVPDSPNSLAGIQAVTAPPTEGMPAQPAYETLVREYAVAQRTYRDALAKHRGAGLTSQVVSLLEPTPVYAEAFMQLADDHRGSTIELQSLKWICKSPRIAGTEQRFRQLRTDAAARILQDFPERKELADAVSSIVYASRDWFAAAELLMNSPHHQVQGRACLTCADIVAQRYLDPYGGGQTALRERAIRLYQRVIDEYSDITHGDGKSISVLAENQLFELKNLQVGAQAPEIEGVDLAGKPMKLSEYRGKVVVIHYWQSSLAFFDELKRIAGDYRDKPLVILGVTTDKDRAEALATATSKLQGLAIRHWHDPDRKIHARWSGSWPCTQVIGHDGKILYKGQRKSRTPLDDVLDEAVTAAESSHPRSAVPSD